MGDLSDPFAKHGLTHLSPTQINSYAADPAYWAFKYILGNADPAGEKAWRGSAVEAGLDYWLFKRDKGAAQKAALDRFELEAQGDLDEKVDKQRLVIFPMLDMAMDLFDGHETPAVRQLDIQYWIDGIEVPIIGKIDYEWPEFGVDLKTTHRFPRGIPDGHARQISVYQAARKKPYKLAYVTEKTAAFKEMTKEEYELQLKRVAWYAHNIRRGLATFSDKMELARLYPPNFDSFYWSNQEARQKAIEIWEL